MLYIKCLVLNILNITLILPSNFSVCIKHKFRKLIYKKEKSFENVKITSSSLSIKSD